MARVLVVSNDVVGSHMAGPGIRYWELGRALARGHEVAVACPNEADLLSPPLEPGELGAPLLLPYGQEDSRLKEWAQGCDVVVTCGDMLEARPWLKELEKPLVIDLYDPFILENLELNREYLPQEQEARHKAGLWVLARLLEAGDFFLCANERQRDFWLGMLVAQGRVSPKLYGEDGSLRHLIDVVPFGVPAEPPLHERQVLKGVWPGIAEGDKVLLWGGGLWDWLDPLTAVRALAWLKPRRDGVRLFFMGTRHPNRQAVPEMRVVAQARRLSQELGLLDRYVFFNDWVPYGERQNYLLEADLGLSLHLDLAETRYSSRTRILDYIWAGLPMIVSEGDPLAELVERWGLGKVVDWQDEEQVGQAVLHLLESPDLRARLRPSFQTAAASLRWDKVCEPLRRFCAAPYRTTDQARDATYRGGPEHGRLESLEQALRAKEAEAAQLRELVEGYRRGRIMRAMTRVQGVAARILGGSHG